MQARVTRWPCACITHLWLLVATGCYLPDPCDEGQTYNRDRLTCTVEASASADAGADDAGACSETTFGQPCSIAADCSCDTDFCAVQPGQSAGFCTTTGCLEVPDACAEGFVCLDVSGFSPDLGSICVPE